LTESSNNLPAVPGIIAFKDRPEAVQVISHNDIPPIVARMQRVNVADETIAEEHERYTQHAALTTLSPSERAAKAALDALGDGRVLVDLHATLFKSIDTSRTKLAIARPSRNRVYLHTEHRNSDPVRYRFHERKPRRGRKPFFVLDRTDRSGKANGYWQYVAAVPPVPPEIRVGHPDYLKDPRYLVLWEADWTQIASKQPRPPLLDPALLYQVSGALYSVVAVWNLTALEEASLKPGPRF
jgi:hypothetical protein